MLWHSKGHLASSAGEIFGNIFEICKKKTVVFLRDFQNRFSNDSYKNWDEIFGLIQNLEVIAPFKEINSYWSSINKKNYPGVKLKKKSLLNLLCICITKHVMWIQLHVLIKSVEECFRNRSEVTVRAQL